MDHNTSKSHLIIEEDFINLGPPPPDFRRMGHSVIPIPHEIFSHITEENSDVDISFLQDNVSKSKVLIEYFYLKDHIPKGIYCIPSFNDFSEWHGIIFVHHGLYKGGIFRFVIFIPKEYPNQLPALRFYTEVYHPLVDQTTGTLDLEEYLNSWDSRTKLLLVLYLVRDIFYSENHLFPKSSSAQNSEALELINNDKKKFMEKIELCVKAAREFFYSTDPEFSLSIGQNIDSKTKTIRKMIKTAINDINPDERKTWFLDWLGNYMNSFNQDTSNIF